MNTGLHIAVNDRVGSFGGFILPNDTPFAAKILHQVQGTVARSAAENIINHFNFA